MTSRNAFLGNLQEHAPETLLKPTLALSLIVRYYCIDTNANTNFLMNLAMDNLYSKIYFRRGRCEISVISHRPPYNKNMFSKFVSRHFIRL